MQTWTKYGEHMDTLDDLVRSMGIGILRDDLELLRDCLDLLTLLMANISSRRFKFMHAIDALKINREITHGKCTDDEIREMAKCAVYCLKFHKPYYEVTE